MNLPEAELAPSSPMAEVRDALEGLGYQSSEVWDALKGLGDGDESVEVLLKAALQRLGGA